MSTSGCSVDSGSSPHQSAGSAPRIPSSASRDRAEAAARTRAGGPTSSAGSGPAGPVPCPVTPGAATVSGCCERSCRPVVASCSSSRRNPATRAPAVRGRGTSVRGRSFSTSLQGSTRSRKSEGWWFSEDTAMPMTRSRARETAVAKLRSSSWRTSASRER
ncbi:hypothetical protein ACFFX0_07520 [Citricoccus parietis]|uniref:Uncharacterized protein n=1 Tax=Citricoccus parietis TaxID=592307 RepID=A0ABV5FWI2_9MICC